MPVAPSVLGVILRIETRGWQGPPPQLPLNPIRIEAGASPLEATFFYDLSPGEEGLPVEAACARIGSRIDRMLRAAEALGAERVFAARCRLEVGLWVGDPDAPCSYVWPADFLQILAAADVELGVSHYFAEAGAPEEDDGTRETPY